MEPDEFVSVDERLVEMGIEIVEPPQPVACYRRCVRTGNLVFVAGHGPVGPSGDAVTGRLGVELSVDEGYDAARQTGINMLNSLFAELGSLDYIARVVKLVGYVQSGEAFHDQPKVIDGCSELFRDVFGEQGIGVRSAVGVASLPLDWAVEIEGVVEIK